jgi:hypothetical protein
MEEGHNTMGIKEKYKMTNNDLLHSTQKIIYRSLKDLGF